MNKFRFLCLLAFITVCVTASNTAAQTASNNDKRPEWIASVIKDVQKINVGMTRGEMRKVFGEEGGLSNTSRRTYVYLGCPYIKVDFEFEPRGREIKDTSGRYSQPESDLDVITKMSKPYLEFTIAD